MNLTPSQNAKKKKQVVDSDLLEQFLEASLHITPESKPLIVEFVNTLLLYGLEEEDKDRLLQLSKVSDENLLLEIPFIKRKIEGYLTFLETINEVSEFVSGFLTYVISDATKEKRNLILVRSMYYGHRLCRIPSKK